MVCVCMLQIENIDACLGFLATKGVNIKGLCAEGKWMCVCVGGNISKSF